MFNLSCRDLAGKILNCAGGTASFNTEATRQGYHVVSSDPIYRFTIGEITDRIDETYETVLAGAKANRGRYRHDGLPSLGFDDGAFDLALCSHFLFTYSDLLSADSTSPPSKRCAGSPTKRVVSSRC